ncbi:MAG: hypothetical protein M5U12_30300 [Verrucomicrobia bacterium]|nr:hypothetical protein [Verrucomicrobiota bacterium]
MSEWVWVPDYPKPDRVMSLSAWVWAESLPTWASIAKNWGDPSATGQFHFGLNESAGDLSNYITQGGGGVVSARTQQPLPTGKWGACRLRLRRRSPPRLPERRPRWPSPSTTAR